MNDYVNKILATIGYIEPKPPGFVYVAVNSSRTICKIGYSTNPKKRERSLPHLKMIVWFPGDQKMERRFHKTFKQLALGRERFELKDNLLAWVEQLEAAKISND